MPYAVIAYPMVFVFLVRLWSVSHRHGFVTLAGFVRARSGPGCGWCRGTRPRGPSSTLIFPALLRREALCHIPSSVGRNLEERSWV